MKRILLAYLLATSAQSSELAVNFTEHNFNGSYHHQTYIKDGNYIHIDNHYEPNEFAKDMSDFIVPHVPKFYSLSLTALQESQLVARLVDLGINDWERTYPKPNDYENQICDGLSFNLYISHSSLRVLSHGACEVPPKYDEVVKEIYALHEQLKSD